MFSQALWKKTGSNIITALLGTYHESEQRPGQMFPVGGLAWILAPPYSFRSAFFHPLHTILHTSITLFMSAMISKIWLGFSGESAEEQFRQLKEAKWTLKGHRDESMLREL